MLRSGGIGRRVTGYFDIRKLDGEKIHASINCKKLKLIERGTSFLWDRTELLPIVETRGIHAGGIK